jgi:uncharacterized protein (TIGR03067 family)
MRLVCFAGFSSAVILVASGCNQQQGAKQATSLDGDWSVVAMRGDGVTATPAELKGQRWSVKGSEIIGFGPDGSSGKMSFTLDQTETPHKIDITAVDGNRKGETDAGIYSLEDQRLRICLAEVGKDRPDEFRVGPESWIMELERIRR